MKGAARRREKEATILVIVYEHVVRDILARTLAAKGHKVVACSVGVEGIRRFEKGKGKFDLVVVDIRLPFMSGLDVGKRIKKISKRTPVILVKGWDMELDARELNDSGVDFLISKPLYVDRTLDLLEKAMEMEAG